MKQNPIIKALREELAKERDDEMTAFELCTGPVGYCNGHKAASARLLTIIEKAVEMANFYAPSNSYDYDKTQGVNYIWNDQGKKAREFLTTLADASGEIEKDGK